MPGSLVRTLAAGIPDVATQRTIRELRAAVEALANSSGTVSVALFNATTNGIVPASGGGSTNFLRADGTWNAPPTGTGDVSHTRQILTTTPLSGGGDLSADRTLSIIANGITDALLRQGAATSVIGRAANSTGNVADVAASADGQKLGRSGGSLTWAIDSFGMFGTGIDGNVHLTAGTTTLTRDMYYDTLTMDDLAILKTAGFRVFVKTALIGPASGTATIQDNGANGANGGAGGAARSATVLNTSSNGGAGGNGNAFGTAGSTNTGASPGGAPGAGGNGGLGVGGTLGTTPAAGGAQPTVSSVNNGSIFNILAAVNGYGIGASTIRFQGGAGGGGGNGCSTLAGVGGGGGAGGGYVVVCAPTVTNPSHVVISTNGGNGGNGTISTGAGTGGGGGGGGGYAVLVQGYGTNPTVQANGGAHGVKAGTGGDGVDGSVGQVLIFNLSGL